MPALNLIITNAGAALIAQAGQVGPVVLSQVAVGTASWVPDATATALRTQVATFAAVGSVSASSGVIHITARDSSNAAYTACELGIFANNAGALVLFAIYSQPAPIFTKATGSVGLVAADFVITGLPPGAVTVGNATFAYPPATQEAAGVSEIASQDEVNAGVDALKIVTPATLATYSGAFLQKSSNLSDVANPGTARGNLGLGSSATYNAPVAGNAAANQVVLGNDGRLSDTRTPSANSVAMSTIPQATITALISAINNSRYPIGEIFITHQAATSGAVAALLVMPGSVWTAYGAGQVLVGFDAADVNFNALDKTGGADTVTLTTAQIPAHTHPDGEAQTTVLGPSDNSGGQQTTLNPSAGQTGDNTGSNTGGGGAHNNLQPYITVYFWQRTA